MMICKVTGVNNTMSTTERKLYNEGRVVGYSAYEIYVKQFLSEHKDDASKQPATEREWLSASISSGSALLYKFPKVSDITTEEGIMILEQDTDWIYQIPLPAETRLGAATNILGSLFIGSGKTADPSSGWVTHVIDYGGLVTNGESIDESSKSASYTPTDDTAALISEYVKIIDGVVLQPGTWKDSGVTEPQKDLSPDLSNRPIIRLHIRGPITKEFYILFTGFTSRAILEGTTGLDGSINTSAPEDGDFLGPAVYPWANKIIFSLPTCFANYLSVDLSRKEATIQGSTIADLPNPDLLYMHVGNKQEISLPFSDSAGNQYPISKSPNTSIEPDNNMLQWATILKALISDAAIDLLGERLRSMKNTLTQSESSNADMCPYIEFGTAPNIKRLYISSTKPTGTIPEGSIGIGWSSNT